MATDQPTMSNAQPVTLVSTTITGTVAVTQSGTWTVQPGNTANTTAWKVDGSAVTQPVSYATTGSGTATGAIRVELPTNGTGVIATVGAVTAITNALPSGTNAIGKLAANSGVDIGDVDVTSILPGTGATNLGKAEDAAHTTGDTGVFMLTVRNDNGATTYSANGDYQPLSTDLGGSALVVQKAATGTLSNVASSATSVTLLAANSARKGATIYNDSTQTLYVKFGATASTSSFTVLLAAASYYEVPSGYSGIIDGIWSSANGNARVTEIT